MAPIVSGIPRSPLQSASNKIPTGKLKNTKYKMQQNNFDCRFDNLTKPEKLKNTKDKMQ